MGDPSSISQQHMFAQEWGDGGLRKRKWGPEDGNFVSTGEASMESGRFMKRRNGAEMGGGGSSVEKGVGGGEVVGAQTRKRKSLDKLATLSSSEQDQVSALLPDGSSKKRRAGGGQANGLDPADVSDEGTAAPGPALRLRFTRKGNAFAVKRGPADGFSIDGTHNGEEEDGVDEETLDEQVLGEVYRSKGRPEAGLSRRGGMEGGEPSTSDGAFTEERDHLQPVSGAAVADGATNSLPSKGPEPRQPLTWEIYRIPSHAGWFCWSKIHNIERRTLSEFFDGKSTSKTPKIYKDYRDYIINKYRENMQRNLTFTEVRRMLIGDVNALRRIFDFLDHWGLINHQVSLEFNEQSARGEPCPIQTMVEPIPSGLRVGVGSIVTPPTLSGRPGQSEAFFSGGLAGVQLDALSSYKNAYGSAARDVDTLEDEGSGNLLPKYTCNSCSRDCMKLRFCCQDDLQAEFNLCEECFKNGKYRPGMVARDFTRIEAETKASCDLWTTKETLSLLEALSHFGENWNQVADHVGTKSKSECVEQFIQLPFGDRFLCGAGAYEPVLNDKDMTSSISEAVTDGSALQKANVNVSNASESTVSAEQGAADKMILVHPSKSPGAAILQDPTPFADVSNPILAQVAFMSAMVGPRVAAAAAQAAISAIAEDEPAVASLPLLNGHALQSAFPKENVTAVRQPVDSLKEVNKPEIQNAGAVSHQGPNNTTVEKAADAAPAVAPMKAGIATALGAAAANAKLLADQEEREMEHLMSGIIEIQLKKMYSKLEHFEELEMLLEKERLQIEQARQLLYAQHIQFAESRFYLNRDRHG